MCGSFKGAGVWRELVDGEVGRAGSDVRGSWVVEYDMGVT